MIVRSIIVIFVMMVLSINVYAYFPEGDYGVIKGTNVNMRAQSSVKASKKRTLEDREVVIVIGTSDNTDTIGNDTDYWYMIKTQSDEEGWVFGKFIEVYSKSAKNEEFSMINDILCNVSNFDREGKYYVDAIRNIDSTYYYISHREKHDHEIYGYDSIYKKKEKDLEVVIFGYNFFRNIYVDNYIYSYDESGIVVFSPSQTYTEKVRGKNVELYKIASELYVKKTTTTGSFLEFDPKTKAVIMHQRANKSDPFIVQKFAFKNGKFEKIE